MAWIVLVLSGLMETVWATALAQSDGFRNMRMILVFLVAMVASMAGLGYALRELPVGTAYAVWTGIGAVGTALFGIAFLGEPASVGRIVCLALIVSGIVGLAGGLGGFVLPILFGALMDLTGIRSSAFMLLYGVVWVSLIWMYWTEVRKTEMMGRNAPASPLSRSFAR